MRLEVEESIAPAVLELLVSELGVSEDEVFRLPGPLDLRGLHGIADLAREDLKYPAFVPTTHPRLAEVESAAPVDVFKATRGRDVLLHHPVRLVRHQRAALPRAGRRRPARARDQADALPHLR